MPEQLPWDAVLVCRNPDDPLASKFWRALSVSAERPEKMSPADAFKSEDSDAWKQVVSECRGAHGFTPVLAKSQITWVQRKPEEAV